MKYESWNNEQQKALEVLSDLTEDDASEVIVQWLLNTGRNPALIVERTEELANS